MKSNHLVCMCGCVSVDLDFFRLLTTEKLSIKFDKEKIKRKSKIHAFPDFYWYQFFFQLRFFLPLNYCFTAIYIHRFRARGMGDQGTAL